VAGVGFLDRREIQGISLGPAILCATRGVERLRYQAAQRFHITLEAGHMHEADERARAQPEPRLRSGTQCAIQAATALLEIASLQPERPERVR